LASYLESQKGKIEQEIESILMGGNFFRRQTGFSWTNEILRVFEEAGENGLANFEALQRIRERYPDMGISAKRVNADINDLVSHKKQLVRLCSGNSGILPAQEQ
jgi:hypothetical protein